MHSKRHQRRRYAIVAQLSDPFVNIECCFRSTTTVIFAGLGIAENGERTVSLRSDDATTVLRHRAMPDLPQLAEEFGKVLGLDIPTQGG
ncbi:hypothetical protein AOQ72_31170 [Bradyrhizobium yuanmingense]|uniref:Uncharacterized protein n=1 Tax=Bradyrhizobium yuanmingense TaxID=108015 RepID=A0A0R3C492_9BRAD|nr:hypothetical protein AOQ72_31170 [Bradyrhizobium yuanmingense]